MKNGILAGLGGVLAAGVIVLSTTGGDPSICPEVCPGEQCLALANYCLVMDKGRPKRVTPEGAEVKNPAELAAEKQDRMLICCVTDEVSHQEDLAVRWSAEVPPPQNCLQVIPPGLFGGISMNGVDLGHAEPLNQVCCKRKDGPVVKGNWGACPRCAYRCQAGRPVYDSKGCGKFCAVEEP